VRPELARKYLDLFEVLFGGATPGETKKWINVNNALSSDAAIVGGLLAAQRRGRSWPYSA
jgi:hypothetical protein